MTWALYSHPESDALFWSEEWPNNGDCDDVTDIYEFREAALQRGEKTPPGVTPISEVVNRAYIEAEVTSMAKGSIASAITKSYKLWKRKPADLYPTPVEATESIIDVIKAMRRPDGKPIKTIWEPACGDGRIARVLEHHGFTVISTDLREYPGWGYGGINFITEHPEEKWGWELPEIDLILTNPPFVNAEAFIRRALELCPNVMLLLKQTYWNTKGRIALWEELTPSMELKLTWRLAFLRKERGGSPLMDCMWAVWHHDPLRDDNGQPICVAEPLKKKLYPGYGDIGLKPAMQVLEGELLALDRALAVNAAARG